MRLLSPIVGVVVWVLGACSTASPPPQRAAEAPLSAPPSAPSAKIEATERPRASGEASVILTSVAAYERACELGSALGCNDLGAMYLDGSGVKRDDAKASSLLKKACDLGLPMGCFNFGFMLETGRGVAEDIPAALELYDRGCKVNIYMACARLASFLYDHLDDRGAAKRAADASRAYGLFTRACGGGVAAACASQGWMLQSGEAGEKNVSKAAMIYEDACGAGAWLGCVGLGNLFMNGEGVPEDPDRALELYGAACKLEAGGGCLTYGRALFGRSMAAPSGGKALVEKARAALDASCKAGSAEGCTDLGALLKHE